MMSEVKAEPKAEVKRSITIRKADPWDAVNIMRLAESGLQESLVQYPPFEPQTGLAWVQRVMERGFVVVADLGGRIVGSIGMEAVTYPWSSVHHLQDAWFYVLPKFRGNGTAAALLKAVEGFADQHKIRITVSFSGGRDAELKDVFMLRQRYVYGGGNFIRLPTGA